MGRPAKTSCDAAGRLSPPGSFNCYLTNTWIVTLTAWPPSPYAVNV
jgi:hypothetical protein